MTVTTGGGTAKTVRGHKILDVFMGGSQNFGYLLWRGGHKINFKDGTKIGISFFNMKISRC